MMKESSFYLAAYNIDMISLQTEIENVLHKNETLDCSSVGRLNYNREELFQEPAL